MKLELIYRDICRGYSELLLPEKVFVKHLNTLEESSLQEVYDTALQKAKDLGALPESEIVKKLIQEGKWTDAKERSIKSCELDMAQLESSKKKIQDYHQIHGVYNAIEELRGKRLGLLEERYSLIKNSAEGFAANTMREQQMLMTCFKDLEFTEKKFNEEFEYFDAYKTNDLYNSYYTLMSYFGGDYLKKLTINTFFWPLFTLSENPFDFFGIPLYKLTTNQGNLLRYGNNYAKVASETGDLPAEFEGNPDKIVMYWYWKRNGGDQAKDEQQATANKFRQVLNSRK